MSAESRGEDVVLVARPDIRDRQTRGEHGQGLISAAIPSSETNFGLSTTKNKMWRIETDKSPDEGSIAKI